MSSHDRGKKPLRSKNAASPLTSNKLAFERLEPRQMLAGDAAEVVGSVLSDLQGDGNPANDAPVVGASVALFRDGGNGVFGGDDSVVTTTSTDASGKYQFSGVGAGKYFVRVTPPAGTQFQPGQDVREVNVSAAEADGILGQTIDGFTTNQFVEASPPLPSSEPKSLLDPNVLGGERDLYVELTEGASPIASVGLASGGGLLWLSSDPTVTGNAKIVWDGADGNGLAINPTGLGGVDLTQHEGNTMTGIALTSGADHPNAQIKLRIYTDANNWSEFVTLVPESVGGAAVGQAVFRFDDAPVATSGSGADFSNVGALELNFEGVSALDGQVSLIGLVGRATKTADFTAAPELTLGNNVWVDANDDGVRQPGEAGIPGVAVNLYADTNADGQFTSGVDALVASDTTDSQGNYLFAGLLPGDYVVQVAQQNFNAGAALDGLVSSSGTAADPDNDVDLDDNGTPLAGAGVVSRAVTLVAGSEPITDGDANPSSNLSVDFGFFGFDLELVKDVDKAQAAPLETLTYTVTITNAGPSAAENAIFSDALPAGVTYVSGSTSTGAVVTHSAGQLSSSLGTIAPGASVVVTFTATIDALTLGTLVNEATVNAPKEIDLSNNTDDAVTTVTPRIDLTVQKIDSQDPVEPGAVFSYTITAVNNGPSNATGVTLTDTLPPEVMFVSASQTPVSASGDQIVFSVGDLARGGQTSVTVDVRVDPAFVGQLLNTVEVAGNETETTYNNNVATEPTLVRVDPASLGGNVYVDTNKNGQRDPGERPIANVQVELSGLDMTGAAVTRTTTTNAQGDYLFEDLMPGTYRVLETQPSFFDDGEETIGTSGGRLGTNPGPFLVPQNLTDAEVKDLVLGVELGSGENATDYDFGELAVTVSKRQFTGALWLLSQM
ncbi:MAG: SdrD B-like domain-containing protein [Planctomycetota bacterium]